MNSTLERLERLARRDHEEDVEQGRTISYRLCSICGTAQWTCSKDAGKGFKVEIDGFTEHIEECGPCGEVFRRNPELARWLLRVLAWNKEETPGRPN